MPHYGKIGCKGTTFISNRKFLILNFIFFRKKHTFYKKICARTCVYEKKVVILHAFCL